VAGEINLLPQREYEFQKREQVQRWLYLASVVVLILELSAVIGVFGFLGIRSLEIEGLNKQIEDTKTAIQNLSSVESLQMTLKQKASKIASITQNQRRFDKALEKVTEVMPNGVRLSGIDISDHNELSTSGEAQNSAELSSFLLNLIDEEKGGKYFDEVNVNSLSRVAGGLYDFGLNMKVKAEVFQ
jgi:Tfp pilus assembly protein PilN